jgi:hypothetical protein
MRFRLIFKVSFVLLTIEGVLLCHPAGAVAPCTDLPSSTFRIFGIKASAPEAVEVPVEELDRNREAEGGLASRHTLMITLSDFVSWFEVTHRVVPRADGSVCDAPSLVRMGFGSSRRLAFLARGAAEDACVRQKMLEHEAAHSRAFDEVVDRFIADQQYNLRRGMAALKQAPAPNENVAKARWEEGVRAIAAAARQQLLSEIQSAIAGIDEPSAIAALKDACDGKIRQLEQRSGFL